MASIIENYKKFNAEWKIWNMFDLISGGSVSNLEWLFIEATLFMELYSFTGGVLYDDESEHIFKGLLKTVNQELNKLDDIALRNKQINLITTIYKRHYHAWSKSNLKIPYMLIAYINRVDFSYKTNYIEKRYGINKDMNNFKFKERQFEKALNVLQEYWKEIGTFDIKDANLINKYEIIKTIIKIQDKRGFTQGDEYE